MRLRTRVFIIVGIVILVSNVLFLVWWQTWTVKANKNRQAYVKAVADAKRAGLPISATDLQVPLPPPDQNAALLYDQMQHLVADPTKVAANVPADPTDQQIQATRRELKRAADLMALIHQSVARPYCVFARNWSDPPAMQFKEGAYIRMVARLIRAQSRVLDWDGKLLEAVSNQALGFRIARQTSEGMLLDYLVGQATDAITLSGLQQILYHDGSDAAVVEAVRNVVERDYRPLSPAYALRTEFGSNLVTLGLIRNGGPRYLVALSGQPAPNLSMSSSSRFWNDFVNVSGLKLIRRMRRLVDAADLPFPQANRVGISVEAEVEQDADMTNWVCTLLLPSAGTLAEKRVSAQARAEETRAGAAVLAWKARHGAFPDTLEAVMNPVPVDPFDGKPLRYRREGAGFVVYTVGKDGKFDGGTPDKKPAATDVAFHYPMPAYMKTK